MILKHFLPQFRVFLFIYFFFTNKTKIIIGAENVFEIYLNVIYIILAGFPCI